METSKPLGIPLEERRGRTKGETGRTRSDHQTANIKRRIPIGIAQLQARQEQFQLLLYLFLVVALQVGVESGTRERRGLLRCCVLRKGVLLEPAGRT